jgi:hypothetical protein
MGNNLTTPHAQDNGEENSHRKLPVIDPDDWIGCTYLMDEQDPDDWIGCTYLMDEQEDGGSGPITFHLGCDFYCDEHGMLCMEPKKYIEKMVSTYEQIFGQHPSHKFSSPLEKGDHPELDTSPFLLAIEIQQYQSLVSALQWAALIVRIDITTAVMTMSSVHAMPCQGHMDCIHHIYGYLHNMNQAAIHFQVSVPDYSSLPDQQFDWAKSVYGNISEE